MTTMPSEAYDALRDAQGASDEKARRAAECTAPAVAAYDARFAGIRGDIGGSRVEFTGPRGEIRTLRWMVGFNTALTVAVLHESSVGARDGPEDERGLAHIVRRFTRARGLDPDAPGPGRPP